MAAPLYTSEKPALQLVPPLGEVDGAATSHPALPDNVRWLLDHMDIGPEWETKNGVYTHLHQSHTIELRNGNRHRRLHSEALEIDTTPQYELVNLLGWTESVDALITRDTQVQLSHANPHIAVNTEATFGIDGTGIASGSRGSDITSSDAIAKAHFEMMMNVYPDTPIVVTATSKAAGELARLDRLNDKAGRPLTIIGRILYEPALVNADPTRVALAGRVATAARFLGHMPFEYGRHVSEQPGIRGKARSVISLARSMPHVRDSVTILRQGLHILEGTDMEDIVALAEKHPTKIQGTLDCLKDPDVDALPFVAQDVEGVGHAMGADALARAGAITLALRNCGL
jgi:hypothetical protein